MKIGITGGAGFIGGYVVDEALAMGHDVVVFDPRGRTNNSQSASAYPNQVSIRLGDVRDGVAFSELAAHVDGIIHLAACLGTQETIKNPRPALETNGLGGVNFLEACAQYDIPGVNIGVGNHWMNNSYSITKSMVERFVRMYNKERGTRINQVRAVNAYGPRQSVAAPYGPAKVRKIMPSFVCRALVGDPIEVYGDGQQVSDMVHVRDVASALIQSLEFARSGHVFENPTEVGPLISATVLEVAQLVAATVSTVMGKPPVSIDHLPMRPGEQPGAHVIANTDTLRQIHMDPYGMHTLGEGVAETVEWFRRNWLPGYRAEHSDVLRTDSHICTDLCHPGNCAVKDF